MFGTGQIRFFTFTTVCLFGLVQTSYGATLNAMVTTASDDPVRYAVISAHNDNANGGVLQSPSIAIVDQIDKVFIEHVTAIQVGAAVSFPNHDNIRHHVYSFSEAKSFEIPLYKGMPTEPVVFENTGVVTLGCNIHDWMSAYIYVVDTPFFGTTGKDGHTGIQLPAGSYEIRIWHPQLEGNSPALVRRIDLTAGSATDIRFQLKLKPSLKPRRGPLPIHSRGRYR